MILILIKIDQTVYKSNIFCEECYDYGNHIMCLQLLQLGEKHRLIFHLCLGIFTAQNHTLSKNIRLYTSHHYIQRFLYHNSVFIIYCLYIFFFNIAFKKMMLSFETSMRSSCFYSYVHSKTKLENIKKSYETCIKYFIHTHYIYIYHPYIYSLLHIYICLYFKIML